MKTWTQQQLPLTIVEDLGLIYTTDSSTKKVRYMVFKCPICDEPFRAEPSKIASKVRRQCKSCSNKLRTTSKVNPITGLKKCNTCNIEKETSEFYTNSRRHDNLESRCKECVDNYKAKWVANNTQRNSDNSTNSRLLKRYGITLEQYNELLEEQHHVCKICGKGPKEGRGSATKLSVDHCHTTGQVRGLLCQKCNTGIGLLGDSSEGVKKALQYLQEAEK